jgi:hypothetical protein
MTLDHLSYSSISTYLSCAAYWRMKYIDQIPIPTSPELVFGSAFHGTVEAFVQLQDDDSSTIQGELLTLWSEQWGKQTAEKPVDWGDNTPEFYQNEGTRILGSAEIQRGILSIKAKEIERKVELAVPGVPVPIVGYIDVIMTDGIPGDFKTSKYSWTPEKANSEIQPLFYLAALYQAGIEVPGFKFTHYIFTKAKNPQFQAIDHYHKPEQMMWLFQMIQNVWKAIESGIFPENPTTWRCSKNYCEFWELCRGR